LLQNRTDLGRLTITLHATVKKERVVMERFASLDLILTLVLGGVAVIVMGSMLLFYFVFRAARSPKIKKAVLGQATALKICETGLTLTTGRRSVFCLTYSTPTAPFAADCDQPSGRARTSGAGRIPGSGGRSGEHRPGDARQGVGDGGGGCAHRRLYIGEWRGIHVYGGNGRFLDTLPTDAYVMDLAISDNNDIWVIVGEQVVRFALRQ
jgi:hypothetical protein